MITVLQTNEFVKWLKRLYYARRDNAVVLLLIGGDKSSQQRDVAKAKKLNLEYR